MPLCHRSTDRLSAILRDAQVRAASATRETILEAARRRLLEDGFARLSTRGVADAAGVPLSQLHYHFGSKQQLIFDLLEAENARRLARQTAMYGRASARSGSATNRPATFWRMIWTRATSGCSRR